MNPTPTPSPLPTMILQQAPAQDWQITLQFITAVSPLLAAALLGLIAALTLRQRWRADAREEWWRRVQWALDAAFSDHEVKRIVGASILGALTDSSLAGNEESKIIEQVWEARLVPDALAQLEEMLEDGSTGEEE